jgi:uncharacterized protein YraI
MTLANKLLTATAALVLSASSALAAVTTTDLNMRAARGTGSAVIAVIPQGAQVDVLGRCASGWCRVGYGGRTGFVSARYLQGEGTGVAAVEVAPAPYVYGYYDPYYEDDYYYGPSVGVGVAFGHRSRWRGRHWAARPGRWVNQPGWNRGGQSMVPRAMSGRRDSGGLRGNANAGMGGNARAGMAGNANAGGGTVGLGAGGSGGSGGPAPAAGGDGKGRR